MTHTKSKKKEEKIHYPTEALYNCITISGMWSRVYCVRASASLARSTTWKHSSRRRREEIFRALWPLQLTYISLAQGEGGGGRPPGQVNQ